MPDRQIEEIKSRLDLVDIVKEYVKLEKVGSNFRSPCPFHAEKTPSFFVSPSRQTWRCFGSCSEGGDIFDFIMKIEGIEFFDALKLLAKKAGVELEKRDIKEETKVDRFYQMYELATKFFEKQLEGSQKGIRARKYLIERGITEESINKFRLGYSPDSWQSLLNFLISKGYKRNEIIESGLAIEKEEKSYDRFRGRIMFPIINTSGRPIAFGGRVFEKPEETAKYLNSPQTALYNKSTVLYGLDKAKIDIRRNDYSILVEGYTDVILVNQAGFKNVISTSGTALTENQLEVLSRYSRNLYIAFDMDKAGNSATKKGIQVASKANFNIKVILLPVGKDPADIVKEDPKQWEKAIEETKDIMEFYFEITFIGKDLENPKHKKEISEEFLPLVKTISNTIEKSHWIKKFAEKVGADEKDVLEELKNIKIEKEDYQKKEKEESSLTKNPKITKKRKEVLEERFLSIVAKYPNLDLADDTNFLSAENKDILSAIKNNSEEDKKIKEKIDYYTLKPEEISNPEEEIKSCLKEIKKEETKEKLKEVYYKIKKAESEKNKEELKTLTEKAYQLSKEFQKYNND